MKRINPKEVAEAFKQKNLLPAVGCMQGDFLTDHSFCGTSLAIKKVTCACGLGVLLPINNKGIEGCKYKSAADAIGTSINYAKAFAAGFDGCTYDTVCDNSSHSNERAAGFLDGLNAHLETLKTLGLLTEGDSHD